MGFFRYTCILVCSILFFNCTGKKDESETNKSVAIKAVKVVADSTESGKNYVGTVEASSTSSLSFQVMGNVSKVLISEGEKVHKGQLLALLDKATLQNAYDASAASLKQAQDAYNRMKQLRESGSLPEIKWVEVESKLQQAKSMEQISKKNMKDAGLYAPFSGVISRKNLDPGMNVMPGIEALQLADIKDVNIKIAVPENEVSKIEKKQIADISVSALNNKTFQGVVSEKGIVANPLSHTYEVKIKLSNKTLELMPGMVCNVIVHTLKNRTAIVVPNSAVQFNPDGEHFVWLAQNGTAIRRVVQTGALTAKGVIITSGLNEGDMIITEGNQKVSEGTKITLE